MNLYFWLTSLIIILINYKDREIRMDSEYDNGNTL